MSDIWGLFPLSEYFSGVHSPLPGANERVTEEIPFSLRKGRNPGNVKLSPMIDGSGTVWIDGIRSLKVLRP